MENTIVINRNSDIIEYVNNLKIFSSRENNDLAAVTISMRRKIK